MKTNKKHIQQGDVILLRIANIPDDSKIVKKSPRGFVLAEGETTGHAHVIEDDVLFYEKDGLFYLKTDKEVTLKHEEHNQVKIPVGVWEIGQVNEYDPFNEAINKVRD